MEQQGVELYLPKFILRHPAGQNNEKMSKTLTTLQRRNGMQDGLARLVDRLIERSAYGALLKPGSVKKIASADDISVYLKAWPNWHSKPWIVAGLLEPSTKQATYQGPFINDCGKDGFKQQVAHLLKDFDWALFSYFTTYQSEYFHFVSRSPDATEWVNESQSLVEIQANHLLDENPISCFNTASYYDYSTEGWLPYELALQRTEPLPLLLCNTGAYDKDFYHKWNEEEGKREDHPWFESAIARLEPITDGGHFQLYRAVDFEAYLEIWQEVSWDHSIADATFSGDTNLEILSQYLQDAASVDVLGKYAALGSWVYSQIYGGGSDEHHAIFYSKDASITHQLWETLGDDQISRF